MRDLRSKKNPILQNQMSTSSISPVDHATDLIHHIIVLCKDDQVRVRIAAGAFELLLGQIGGNIYEDPFSEDNQRHSLQNQEEETFI